MTKNNKIAALAWACGVFFVAGILVASFGPALPELAANTHSSLAGAGSLFTALFMGALLSQIAIGPIQDRFGARPVLMVGMLITAFGLAAATLSDNLPTAWGIMLGAGLGDGVIVVGVNVMVAVVFASRSVMALNLSNVFYGVGAVAGPAIAAFTMSRWGTALPALWIAAGALALFALAVPLIRVHGHTAAPARTEEDAAESTARPAVYSSPALWALGGLLMLYVGTEIGVGNWAIAYLGQAAAVPAEQAALAASGYWLALTAGRLGGAGAGTRLGSRRLLTVALSGALSGALSCGESRTSMLDGRTAGSSRSRSAARISSPSTAAPGARTTVRRTVPTPAPSSTNVATEPATPGTRAAAPSISSSSTRVPLTWTCRSARRRKHRSPSGSRRTTSPVSYQRRPSSSVVSSAAPPV